MPILGKLALAVMVGGVGLGTILGAAANPEMKPPPEQPWQNALHAPVAADADYVVVIEDGPEDLNPYRDKYAPTWAREELGEAEPVYPAWTYSELPDEHVADVTVGSEPQTEELPTTVAAQPSPGPVAAPQPVDAEPLALEPPVVVDLAALY